MTGELDTFERPNIAMNINLSELAGLERIAMKALRARAQTESSRAAPGRLRRSGMDYSEHRPYDHGDDVRRIDWRTTQRLGQPYIRQFDAEANADWMICLDRSASMSIDGGSKWTLAVQLTEAFAYLCLYTGQRFGLRVFSNEVDLTCPLGRGHAHYAAFVNLLLHSDARSEGGASNIQNCIFGLHRGTALIVISDFLTENAPANELDGVLSVACTAQLVQVLSPRECRLQRPSTSAIRDIESGVTVEINHENAEMAAQTRLEKLRHSLHDYCAEQSVAITQCESDEPWRAVLSRHLEYAIGLAR